MAITMQGISGELRIGYEVAGVLADWKLEPQEGVAFVVRGRLTTRDTYWMDQGPPYDLRLHVGASVWTWRGVDVAGQNGAVTIYGDGRPEVRKV